MDKIDKVVLKEQLKNIVQVMEEEKDYLLELDGSMGDGDLGLTMVNGFTSIYEEIDNIGSDDMGTILMKLGMKMNETVSSTMGTLISICLLKSATVVKGKNELSIDDLAKMGRAAVNGVMERGKAKIGEKTMLDSLSPAVEALESSAEQGKSIKKALTSAYEASKDGVEKTKEITSVHGRAAYYKEKSLGKPDPGAVAMMFIFKGLSMSE